MAKKSKITNRGALRNYLPQAEIDAMLEVAHRDSDPRKGLLIMLQWRAGLRVSEALAVTPADLQFDDEFPSITVIGKGSRARKVPAHPQLVNELQTYMRYRQPPRDQRFIAVSRHTAWRWVRDIFLKAQALGGIPPHRKPINTHGLRHSYARHLLVFGGISMPEVGRWLGHADLSTTEIYAELELDPRRLMDDVP